MGTPAKNAMRKAYRAAHKRRQENSGKHQNKYAEHSRASGERSKLARCHYKVTYPNAEAAHKRALEYKQYAYLCDECQLYHLTKQPQHVKVTE